MVGCPLWGMGLHGAMEASLPLVALAGMARSVGYVSLTPSVSDPRVEG